MNPDSQRSSHAEIFGSPGEGARVSGLFRVLWPFLLILLAAGYLLGMANGFLPYSTGQVVMVDGGLTIPRL